MKNGVINIYKEKGFTSHDVVAKLRGILHQKKIGHTGTLDPDAEGVLPVCLGKGTKLCDLLTDKDKEYRVVMRLGITTDTEDMTGTILTETQDLSGISEEQIREVIQSFVGEYDQIPPMYSALKVNGKKLYELARAGVEVERKARRVILRQIEIHDIQLPYVTMTVECSKGTYIRSLCRDIGEKLQVGACMESLLRTRVSRFLLEESITLAKVEELRDAGKIDEFILPIDEVFYEYPKVIVKKESSKLIYNGNPFAQEAVASTTEEIFQEEKLYRGYDAEGKFIGVYSYNKGIFKLRKFFMEQET